MHTLRNPKCNAQTAITALFLFAQIVLVDDAEEDSIALRDRGRYPVDLQLEWVLGKMPQKDFKMVRLAPSLQSLRFPVGLSVRDALDRVLRLPAVASKRYLTNKVRDPCLYIFASAVHVCRLFVIPPFAFRCRSIAL